jgi:hypothetical protein
VIAQSIGLWEGSGRVAEGWKKRRTADGTLPVNARQCHRYKVTLRGRREERITRNGSWPSRKGTAHHAGMRHAEEVDYSYVNLCGVRRSTDEVNNDANNEQPQQNMNSCHRYMESHEGDQPCHQKYHGDCEPHTFPLSGARQSKRFSCIG